LVRGADIGAQFAEKMVGVGMGEACVKQPVLEGKGVDLGVIAFKMQAVDKARGDDKCVTGA